MTKAQALFLLIGAAYAAAIAGIVVSVLIIMDGFQHPLGGG